MRSQGYCKDLARFGHRGSSLSRALGGVKDGLGSDRFSVGEVPCGGSAARAVDARQELFLPRGKIRPIRATALRKIRNLPTAVTFDGDHRVQPAHGILLLTRAPGGSGIFGSTSPSSDPRPGLAGVGSTNPPSASSAAAFSAATGS